MAKNTKEKNRRGEFVLHEIQALANGFTNRGQLFKTKDADANNYTHNSVIICKFLVESSIEDNNSTMDNFEDFIGYIEQILEIDDLHMKKTILLCKWFESTQRRPRTSVKTDD